jgi:ankyrin repeat protein
VKHESFTDVCAQLHQNTLLHAAASMIESALEPEVAIIEALNHRGIAADARDKHGRTALMLCRCSEIEVVLVARGADVHAVCAKQMTALHYAAQSGSAAMVQFLLAAGASVAAICQRNHFPLSLACLQNDFEVSAHDTGCTAL